MASKKREAVQPEGDTSYLDAYYKPKDQSPRVPRVYDYTGELPADRSEAPSRFGTWVALCLACVILGVGLGSIRSRELRARQSAEPVDRMVAAMTTIRAGAETLPTAGTEELALSSAEVYGIAREQTVEVRTEQGGTVNSGSGLILTADGFVLTNARLLESAGAEAAVTVVLPSGVRKVAQRIGVEYETSDLAVLKIAAEGLSVPKMGDINTVSVGDRVYAVGNVSGESCNTMSEGMIIAPEQSMNIDNEETGRSLSLNLFRISAPVNKGNAGGAVYNDRGQVIGIVLTHSLGTETVTYCIPVNDAEVVSRHLMESTDVGGKPHLGIIAQTVSGTVAEYYNRYSPDSMVPGVQVYALDENGSGSRAGLLRGDIITRFGSLDITSESDLTAAESEYRAGEDITLTVYRAGAYEKLSFVLESAATGAEDGFYKQLKGEREF